MFLTVYLSNNDHHFSEVPLTPETLCRDVLELCREPGELHCYLAESWRSGERVVEEGERMLEVLQRWGQRRGEVRYLLHHRRAPGTEPDQVMKRNEVKAYVERCLENGLSCTSFPGDPHLDVTLGDLQDLAARQQQQINVQQQLLASREQQLRSLKLQEQQDVGEQQRLQQLRENAQNQEAKLQRVQALRSQAEQKRLSNGRMVEEMEQMTGLFQQKHRELLEAVSRVEQLSEQLEAFRSSRLEMSHLHHLRRLPHQSSTGDLERLYKELQVRNRLNQEQSVRLQQQRDGLNRRNLEVASMDRRLAELRRRLWRKKAALQQKENVPVSPGNPDISHVHAVGSRVAAVGPYIKSSCQGPPVPSRPLKPAYPDGTATLPMKPPPRPAKPASGFAKLSSWSASAPDPSGGAGHASTLPRMARSGSAVPGLSSFCFQAAGRGLVKMPVPPPLPSKPKPFLPTPPGFSGPPYSTSTLPNKVRGIGGPFRAGHSSTLPLPPKQEPPPAAAVRPYTPDLSDATPPILQKPQMLAASSIYSMYTQQSSGKSFPPGVQGSALRSPSSGSERSALSSGFGPADVSEADGGLLGNNEIVGGDQAELAPPRPLSPTKLLPFQSNPHRNPSDADLDALRRRLHHAPRPLKKRNSITEGEGPVGPHIQKLLYQKTTLAAMETVAMETVGPSGRHLQPPIPEDMVGGVSVASLSDDKLDLHLSFETPEDSLTPPLPDPAPPPVEEAHLAPSAQDRFTEDFPPYPPPPYPGEVEQVEDPPNLQPPEVTGQVTPPMGKRSNLRRMGSGRIDRSVRVKFNPLAILLDSSLEGEYDLVQRVIFDVEDPSMPNDEGITALHNAVCAGHTEIVKFLVQFGVNVNAADSDGWTPLHCAASCNNVQVCKFLVESGAAVFATTYSDMQTAAEKCEEMEDGYAQCSQFLYGVQEKMGVMNRGVVYALWDYEPQSEDELGFAEGDCMTVLRRDDGHETEWWWACCGDSEGYIPRNLLGVRRLSVLHIPTSHSFQHLDPFQLKMLTVF
uniref:Tumor protein p53 binding protein, 2b n=1 Tax=Salarias fasciatus TaxID=181472 RepID=A0A672FEA7_SALFA